MTPKYYKTKKGKFYIKVIESRVSSGPYISKTQGISCAPIGFYSALSVEIDADSNFWPVTIQHHVVDMAHYMQIEITEKEFNKVYKEAINLIQTLHK